jgi:hypothetical protein
MKLMVIGLDSAVPDLVFNRWWDELPNLRSLANGGMWGDLIAGGRMREHKRRRKRLLHGIVPKRRPVPQ